MQITAHHLIIQTSNLSIWNTRILHDYINVEISLIKYSKLRRKGITSKENVFQLKMIFLMSHLSNNQSLICYIAW